MKSKWPMRCLVSTISVIARRPFYFVLQRSEVNGIKGCRQISKGPRLRFDQECSKNLTRRSEHVQKVSNPEEAGIHNPD